MPPRTSRIPSRTTLLAIASGALIFWLPPIALKLRMQSGEHFHAAILMNAVLVPAALFLVWRAWFNADTRAERLGHWVRLAVAGPYAGAVFVGCATYFVSDEFRNWRGNPHTPAASGFLLPLSLTTVIPGLVILRFNMFIAAPVLLILTLFIPKGAHRPLDI
ncbi:MAG: hypothetical protein ACKVS6_03410 [Planctomycetota bacterium]